MKRAVQAFDYAGDICKAMKKGILMTTKNGDFVNSMVIGWGHIGIEWGRPIFVAYVRESRYTKDMVEQHGEFTVNIPLGEVDPQIIKICGTKSGRDMDKIQELGLELEVCVTLDEQGLPKAIELAGAVPPLARQTLANCITRDLGLGEEAQIWTTPHQSSE